MFQIAEMNVSIKKLSIENFKCFKKEQSFDFTKLTILTGANSSGKSSILSAVLGALQSVGFPFKFSTNGKHINMGDFKEISNSHNIENKIKINFTLYSILDNYSYNIFSTWEDDSISHLPILKEVVLKSECVQLKVYKKSSGYFLDFSYDPENDPETKNDDKKLVHEESLAAAEVSFSRVNMNFKSDWTKEKAIEDYKKYLDSYFEKKTITNFKIRMIDEVVLSVRDKKNKRLDDTVKIFLRLFMDLDRKSNFISSFRLHPDRTYLERSREQLKIDKYGDGYLDQIMSWEKNDFNRYRKMISTMKKLSLLSSIRSSRIGGGRYEYLISTNKGGIKTSLFDVGFGINQFLPIIVADLQLPPYSTLFVAEPEIHLHPSVQASFGDYLCQQIEKENKNYVIETHSEYLLNRIRLAIVKGTLSESDLSVYYLENNGKDSVVHKIKFGKKGEIENAPDSFFDTYLMGIRDIALSSFK